MTVHSPRWPTPAERARTLASGVVPGTLLLPDSSPAAQHTDTQPTRGADTVVRVRSYVGTNGDLFVLADELTQARRTLHELVHRSDDLDVPGLLDLLDVPPVRTDLPRARSCVAGWVEALRETEQRAAAVDLAAVRPAADLLSVGDTATLYRLHAAEISLTTGDTTYDVDVDEFRAVEPDPLYENEHEVTDHLQRHHYDELTQWAVHRLGADERRTLRQVTISGVDRYGLDLSCLTASRHARLRVAFDGPVPDEDSLGDALRALDRCHCE